MCSGNMSFTTIQAYIIDNLRADSTSFWCWLTNYVNNNHQNYWNISLQSCVQLCKDHSSEFSSWWVSQGAKKIYIILKFAAHTRLQQVRNL